LIDALNHIEKDVALSKWARMLKYPGKYFDILLYSKLLFGLTKKTTLRKSKTFFGEELQIRLPAATDVYLMGAKSHHSELRLAKFMISQLKPSDHFLDIGAHFGYFSLLAAKLCEHGKILSVDASKASFELLTLNTKNRKNINALNLAIAAEAGMLKFYEFNTKYSEYNSKDIEQYKTEPWFNSNLPNEISIEATTIDLLLESAEINPKIIKIDVEGAEAEVILGAHSYLGSHHPMVVMEYLNKAPKHGSSPHQTASNMLSKLGYNSHKIVQDGSLEPIVNIEAYMLENGYNSDNIVFVKKP